jgi:hypothetical protein
MRALQLAGMSERTQKCYTRAVRELADFCEKTPEQINELELEDNVPKEHLYVGLTPFPDEALSTRRGLFSSRHLPSTKTGEKNVSRL